jgi:hypothetical protein
MYRLTFETFSRTASDLRMSMTASPHAIASLLPENVEPCTLAQPGLPNEEVVATFSAISSAVWAGHAASAKQELDALPEYAYYDEVGRGFAGTLEFPPTRQAVMELLESFSSWSDVRKLPRAAFPDNRLLQVQNDWATLGGARLWKALLQRFPVLDTYRNQSFAEIYDPLHRLKETLDESNAGLCIIERVENLSRKRATEIVPELKYDREYEVPIAGLRSRSSFINNFEVAEQVLSTRDAETTIMYASVHSLLPEAEVEHPESRPALIALHPGLELESSPALNDWICRGTTVAIWTSSFLQDPSGMNSWI